MDLSSLSSRAKLVEKCLGERDVFDALFAPTWCRDTRGADCQLPFIWTDDVYDAFRGGVRASSYERPEAAVASYASSTEFDGASEKRGVCVRVVLASTAPILNSDAGRHYKHGATRDTLRWC